MSVTYAFIFVFITMALLFGAVRLWLLRGKPLAEQVGLLEAGLTIAAILAATYWFVFERPTAAKLKIEHAVRSVPLAGNRALLLIEVSLTNVGGRAVDIKNLPHNLFVEQVTPLPTELSELAGQLKGRSGLVRESDGLWPSLATLKATDAPLSSFIDAGETENLYYTAVLPCHRELRISVRTDFQKPRVWSDFRREGEFWWIKQTFADLTETCKRRGVGAR